MLNPEIAQLKTFQRLKKSLRGAEVANLAGLQQCETLEDFRSLPVSSSESLKPFLNKIFAGGLAEKKIFGKSQLIAFGRTSGTLGSAKDIPINKAYLKSLDRTLTSMVASYLYTTGEWNSLLKGRQVLLSSRPLIGNSPTGVPIADVSGLISTRTWKILRWLYIPRYQDLFIRDWSTRVDLTVNQALDKNVISISGIPALAKDFVERVRNKKGGAFLNQLWPNLHFYIYGAVHLSAEERREISRQWFNSNHKIYFIETYFSTETPMAFSFDPEISGMALNLNECLFLFRSYTNEEKFLFAHELMTGEYYSVHITTPGGLVNYAMGDRIVVLTTRPLLIKVVGRDADEISMTGEKITLQQIDLALNSVGVDQTLHRPVVWVNRSESKMHLVWGLPAGSTQLSKDLLSKKLDESLSLFNILYQESLVLEKVIGPSSIEFIPENIFKKYQDSRLGIGQFKAKRIFNSREEFEKVYSVTNQ